MPPKKKGKGKKGPVLIDGVDTSGMTRDQLEAFALRLKAELEREREERNFFQLERDKIRAFWEVTRGQLEDTRTELNERIHEVEMAHDLSDMDTKHIMQQMKHLQYENQLKIAEVRAEAMTQLKLAQEAHVKQEQELLEDKRELRSLLRERQETNDLQLQQMKIENNEQLCAAQKRFERELQDAAVLHEEKMQALKEEIELVYRMQMFEIEERKNTQIKRLTDSHDVAFNDMKNYYNDITLNNLGLISSLKEQMESLRKHAERNDRIATDAVSENRKLKEPLEQSEKELNHMRRKLEHFDRDRNQLQRLKARNAKVEKQLKSLTMETEALLLRNDTLTSNRDELKAKFNEVVQELQQKMSFKTVLLERKIAMMEEEAEKKEALVQHALAACAEITEEKSCGTMANIQRHTRDKVMKHIHSILDEKNKVIQEMRIELTRVCKAHDDMLATYEAKLLQFDIPKEELGFEPLRLAVDTEKYRCGPAGLVAKNK